MPSCSPRLKKARVRQVVLDKRFPLIHGNLSRALEKTLSRPRPDPASRAPRISECFRCSFHFSCGIALVYVVRVFASVAGGASSSASYITIIMIAMIIMVMIMIIIAMIAMPVQVVLERMVHGRRRERRLDLHQNLLRSPERVYIVQCARVQYR